jgi:hypothetical protein
MRAIGFWARVLLVASTTLIAPVTGASQPAAMAATPTAKAAGTLVMPLPTSPAPAPPDTCAQGVWPNTVAGRPAQFVAGDDAAYLWHDANGGWALRVTHAGPGDKVVFSGTLYTSGQFVDVRPLSDKSTDIVVVGIGNHAIYFRFVDYGWVDGLDFATRCSQGFTTRIDINGVPAPTVGIRLGRKALPPSGNPFRISRARRARLA